MIGKLQHTRLIALTLLILLVTGITSVVFAAAPANDDINSATVITTIPFTDTINTVEATTALGDPDCLGRGPTVWYQFTPSTSIRIEFNTFGSDYDTTLSVYTGSPGALTRIACNDDAGFTLQSRVRFEAEQGQTYFVMVGAYGSGPGGNLVFNAQLAPPPLAIDVVLEPVGQVVASTGQVTVQGTVTCTEPVLVDLFGELTQRAGRDIIRTFFFTFTECDGEAAWSATFTGENGRFVGGKADILLYASAFTDEESDFEELSAEIRLKGMRR